MATRLTFAMPATAAEVFEAFHDHQVRLRWDTLLSHASVEGGGRHPAVGAVSVNIGRGWKRLFRLRTRFMTYDPPYLAAATLVAPAGLFREWSASLRHRDHGDGTSALIYTFSLALRPRWLHRIGARWVHAQFERETRARFTALAEYLRQQHGAG